MMCLFQCIVKYIYKKNEQTKIIIIIINIYTDRRAVTNFEYLLSWNIFETIKIMSLRTRKIDIIEFFFISSKRGIICTRGTRKLVFSFSFLCIFFFFVISLFLSFLPSQSETSQSEIYYTYCGSFYLRSRRSEHLPCVSGIQNGLIRFVLLPLNYNPLESILLISGEGFNLEILVELKKTV